MNTGVLAVLPMACATARITLYYCITRMRHRTYFSAVRLNSQK